MTDYRARAQRSFMYAVVHGIDDDAHLPDVGTGARFEDALRELYHATVDALTEPMPPDVANKNSLSVLMLCEWGLPLLGRELGRTVQAWRNTVHAAAVETLRNVLVTIESEMK